MKKTIILNAKLEIDSKYEITDEVITDILSHATPDDLPVIKLFEGLNIEAKFYGGKETVKPRTGEKTVSEDHIYPRAKFTQAYQLKIRELCNREGEE